MSVRHRHECVTPRKRNGIKRFEIRDAGDAREVAQNLAWIAYFRRHQVDIEYGAFLETFDDLGQRRHLKRKCIVSANPLNSQEYQ